MAVSTTTNTATYQGNGSTTVFDFSFLIPDADSLVVYLTEDDVVTDVDPSAYMASGLGEDAGGSITFTAAPTSSQKVTIQRQLALTQDISLVTGAEFYAEVVESALDRQTMIAQQLSEAVGRCVQVPVGSDEDAGEYLGACETKVTAAAAAAAAAAASATAAASSATSAGASVTSAQGYAATAASDAAAVASALASIGQENVDRVSADTTLTAASKGHIVLVDASSGQVVVTLPVGSAIGEPGAISVQKVDNTTHKVLVRRQGSDTIDGGASDYELAAQYSGARFAVDIDVTPDDWATLPFGVAVGDATPVGLYADFPGSMPPAGWLIRNGAAVSRATYADLFATIGTTFGAGDGSTTFNLPDDVLGPTVSYSSNLLTSSSAISASSTYGSYSASRLIDGSSGTEWASTAPGTPAWVMYDHTVAKSIAKYTLTFALTGYMGSYAYSPVSWALQGSNDGSAWTTLDTQTGQGWSANGDKSYFPADTTAYRYHRLNNMLAASSQIGLMEFKAYSLVSTPADTATVPCIKAFNAVSNQAMVEVGDLAADLSTVNARVDDLESANGGYMHVREEQPSGTVGGTFTAGSYITRTLNTVKSNTIVGASLSGNRVTLPAGTYEIRARATCMYVDKNRARIYDATHSVVLLSGPNGYTYSTYVGQTYYAPVEGLFTLAATSAIELQHRCSTTWNSNGFGDAVSFGDAEVYSEVFIKKVT
jgi:microcystin-dependent protein